MGPWIRNGHKEMARQRLGQWKASVRAPNNFDYVITFSIEFQPFLFHLWDRGRIFAYYIISLAAGRLLVLIGSIRFGSIRLGPSTPPIFSPTPILHSHLSFQIRINLDINYTLESVCPIEQLVAPITLIMVSIRAPLSCRPLIPYLRSHSHPVLWCAIAATRGWAPYSAPKTTCSCT